MKGREGEKNRASVELHTHELRMKRSSQSVIYLLYLRRFSFRCGFLVHFTPFSITFIHTRLHTDSIASPASMLRYIFCCCCCCLVFLLLLQHLAQLFICCVLVQWLDGIFCGVLLFLSLECLPIWYGLINGCHACNIHHSPVFLYHPHIFGVCTVPLFSVRT